MNQNEKNRVASQLIKIAKQLTANPAGRYGVSLDKLAQMLFKVVKPGLTGEINGRAMTLNGTVQFVLESGQVVTVGVVTKQWSTKAEGNYDIPKYVVWPFVNIDSKNFQLKKLSFYIHNGIVSRDAFNILRQAGKPIAELINKEKGWTVR